MTVATFPRFARLVQAGLLLLALPAAAQVKLGETSANANGMVSSGYTATYGNMTDSTHNWTVGGFGTVSGSYHNPNFLSFTISPYLNQSRANSNFQSISNASGVTASANIFAGSHFPGSVTYSEAYNSEGNFAVPGLANFVTHGNSGTFGVNWSENIPDKPSFSAGYQLGSSQYTVYGTSDQGTNNFHSVNLHSGYRWAGFNLAGYYTNGASHADIPQIVAGVATQMHNDNSALGFTTTHALPWQGSFSAGVNRSSWDGNYLGYRTTGTVDTVNSVATMHPTERISISASANYSDNLSGQLVQSVLSAGGVVEGLNTSDSSNSLDLMGIATYSPMRDLETDAFVERRTQSFEGQDYGVRSYGGGASYLHKLMGGTFSSSFVLSANVLERNSEDSLGFSTNENYSNEIRGWRMTGSFGYAQNVQTLLITYMNSYYNFTGNIARNWGYFNMSLGAGGAHTALTQQAGTANSSQSYHAGIGYGAWIVANGSYSKADGQAILTGAGLVTVPVPSPTLPPGLVSLFGGESYAFAASSSPVKKLVFASSFSKSVSSTSSSSISSSNRNNQFNTFVQYQYRKLYFTSGYARLEQGFSGSSAPPQNISSYYMGISRWFNFF